MTTPASPSNPLHHLASDPTGASLGLSLPAGSTTCDTIEGTWHEPLLWVSDSPASSGSWAALRPARALGLLPVLIGPDMSVRGGSDLAPETVSRPGDHDAVEVLAGHWARRPIRPAYRHIRAPFGAAWPGLAQAVRHAPDVPETAAEHVARLMLEPGPDQYDFDGQTSWIALVPARRSADIPAAIGWSWAADYERDVARLCAVLRTWEDRFGARVVVAGCALIVSAAAPPTTRGEAELLAAEHMAFCPDALANFGMSTIREYATYLLTAPYWTFGWD
ncbi:DUF4253 domain-containing protein [Streptomyces sp. N35]|uniref:DUF4253 domain-containing protein n=1 Tax=Streptomyces sp. N35 TaxID=2795730 RepID=UPI0018F63B73|nr:DUF4253 domain-containing protein [Streptomyces sp. N35]